MRRLAYSTTAKTYTLAPFRVVAVKKSQARIAWAWPRRKAAQVWRSRSGAGNYTVDQPATPNLRSPIVHEKLQVTGHGWGFRHPHPHDQGAG
jgi:hypothetical protein